MANRHESSRGSARPGLLVSVRDPEEAVIAHRHGADLIDVKEPSNGPLGSAAPDVAQAIAAATGAESCISIALGELRDCQIDPYLRVLHMPQVKFAKLGLAGLGGRQRWWNDWRRVWRGLPADVGRVGVVYADWQAAAAPAPEDALRVFADGRCSAVLFDTFKKDGQSLVDVASRDELFAWTESARAAAKLLVLAGSLSVDRLDEVRRFSPDYVAVRGAVCEGGRLGRVCGPAVRRVSAAIKRTFEPINV